MARRVRAVVVGRVQGVGFRANAAAEAQRLGLTGWVRNREDGSVELEAQGAAAADVDALLAWLHHGSLFATVDDVRAEELPAVEQPADASASSTGFEIRH